MPEAEPANRNPTATLHTAGSGTSAVRAVIVSVLAHGILAVALWDLEWNPSAIVRIPPEIVPIELRAVTALPEQRVAPEPESSEPTPPSPEQAAVEEAMAIAQQAEPDDEPQRDTRPESEAPVEDPQEPLERSQDVELAPLVPEGYDFELARDEAVARVIEALRTESQYRTFSLDDLPAGGSGTGAGASASEPDIFEAAAAMRSGGVAVNGRARSKVARTIIDLCNQLTGGFSIMGFANVCADPPARADLFGHLRPRYMESLPLCTADEELQIEVEETGLGAVGSFTCVMVPPSVRRELYGQYDPALAGWLPAEPGPDSRDAE